METAETQTARNKTIDISVIVPSFNQKAFIADALDSILAQKTRFNFEVIVVDSSTDATADFLSEKYPQIQLVRLKERAFPGTARNYGIRTANGDILAFTDTDCLVAEDWLEQIGLSQLAGRTCVGGPVGNGTPKSIAGNIEYLLEFNEFLPPKKLMLVDLLPTCNISYHKNIFATFGLFADTIKSSDALYCRMLRAKGEKIYLDPNIRMWHRNRTQLKRTLKNQYNLGTGAALIRAKMSIAGSSLVRYPVLALAIPFLRTIAISRRLLKRNLGYFLKFWALYPIIFVALVTFTRGFFNGLKIVRQNKANETSQTKK